jgi:HEAT repeat protein
LSVISTGGRTVKTLCSILFAGVIVLLCAGIGAGEAEQEIDSLMGSLASPDWEEQLHAAQSLKAMGSGAIDAVPALIGVLNDTTEGVGKELVNKTVIEVLGAIGADAASSVPVLCDLFELSIDSPGTRLAIVVALGRIGDSSERPVRAISVALKDADTNVRRQAAQALVKLGPDASRKEAIISLIEALDDPSFVVRTEVNSALKALWLKGSSLDAMLAASLRADDADMRRVSATALSRYGSESVTPLVEAIGDSDVAVKRAVIESLGKIGPKAESAAVSLASAYDCQDEDVRVAVIRALESIGSPEGLAVFLQGIGDDQKDVRLAAIDALGRIGAASDPVVVADSLGHMLTCDDEDVLQATIKALGLLGVEGLPFLDRALDDERHDVRRMAATTLQQMRLHREEIDCHVPELVERIAKIKAESGPISWEFIEETAARTGYTPEEIERYFPRVELRYDTEGLAVSRLTAPPEPYVHPRVFFNPEDLPDMRMRLSETKIGRAAMGAIRDLLTRRLTGAAAQYAKDYADLAAGRIERLDWPEHWPLISLLTYEAFRCLIDEDGQAAQKLADATVNYAKLVDLSMKQIRATNDYQAAYPYTYHENLGYIYDFLYNYMTKEQQDKVRDTIAQATEGKTIFSADSLPAFPANTSNWIPMHMGIMPLVLSIEGEDGYDPSVYARLVEAYTKWFAMGIFPDGAPFEGMGKGHFGMKGLIPMAKRGDMLIACESARNHISKFYLYAMQPFGGDHFTWDESWGGTNCGAPYADVFVMKYAFPDDANVEFVYRNHVGENYEIFSNVNIDFPWASWNPLYRAMFVVPYDETLSYKEALDRVGSEPLSGFFNSRGLVSARSDWTEDALQLLFQPRSVPGGHTYADRNTFTLSGLGRVFAEAIVLDGSSFLGTVEESRYHNVVTIDDVGQAYRHTPPGVMVAYQDSETATFAVGDARYAYSYRLGEGIPIEMTPNDFRLEKSELPWMGLPWSDLPHWLTSQKGATGHNTAHSVWTPWNPVERAYRTAGLVRGDHPYVLIMDDIKKDDRVHLYKWIMQVPDDLNVVAMYAVDTKAGNMHADYKGFDPNYAADIILGDGQNRRLLIRVLQNNKAPDVGHNTLEGQPGVLETYLKDMRWHRPGKRVVIPSRSVSPDFKVLLFPHRAGEQLPQTFWTGTELTIRWRDQEDVYQFGRNEDGRTVFTMTRDGQEVIAVD